MTLDYIVDSLKLAVGRNTSFSVVISSFVFVLIVYFYLYSLASYLDIPIVIFQNGVTYNALFENTYIFDKNLDGYLIIIFFAIWLMFSLKNKKFGTIILTIFVVLSLGTHLTEMIYIFNLLIFATFPLIVFILIFNKIRTRKEPILVPDTNSLIINYFSISVIFCSIIGIILSSSILVFSISPDQLLVHNYVYPLYVLFSNVTPLLVFLLLFSFFIKYILLEFRSKRFRDNQDLENGNKIISVKYVVPTKVKISFLVIFMAFGIILSLIPQNPIVNEKDQLLGVDTDEYIEWIGELTDSPDIFSMIQQVFITQSMSDRPLTLIVLLLITHVVSANEPLVIEFMPLLLGPLLILVVYLLTKELTSNDIISLFSAFLTAVSFQMLIGLYAGLYANWIALIFGYLSFVSLIKYIKSGYKMHIVAYTALLILTLLSHVYSWTIFTIITGILLLILIKINLFERKRVVVVFIPLFLSILFDIARVAIIESSSTGIQDTISVINSGLSLAEFTNRLNNLFFTVQIFFGGIFSNFVIFALGLYWLIRSKLKDSNTIFIMVFLSIGIIPLFLGDEIIKARILYVIPFQIPAAIALWQMSKNVSGKIMVISICSWMLFVAVRTAFNLYLVEPL